MKLFNWLVNRYLLAGFVLASIACWITAGLMLCYMLFDINPYYEHSNKEGTSKWTIGKDYKSGITMDFKVSCSLSDTSIDYETVNNQQRKAVNNASKIELQTGDSLISADTFYGRYRISPWRKEGNAPEQVVAQPSIESATVLVKPKSILQKIELLLPSLLTLMVLAFSFRQIAKFLQFIQLNDVFNPVNYKRIRSVGVALLMLQFVLLSFDFLFGRYNLSVQFLSTKEGWKNHFWINGGHQESNFSWGFFIAGCICLIVAKAFKEGNQIKQEQDLTI